MRNAYFLLVLIALLIALVVDQPPAKRHVSVHFAPAKLFVFDLDVRF